METTSIPTAEIIARRLCLVCARDGVRKPVSEHDWCDIHTIVTRKCLEGKWLTIHRKRWSEWMYNSFHSIENYHEQSSHCDWFSMAVEVGELQQQSVWIRPDGSISVACRELCDRDEYVYFEPRGEPMWKAGFDFTLYDTPEEAVQRAHMEQLWERSAKHGS